jgi:hypothetical protein
MQSEQDIIEFYNRSLRQNSISLKEIPFQYRTNEICYLAVSVDKKNITQVPIDILNNDRKKFLSEAIRNDVSTIFLIPQNYFTDDLCYQILNHKYIYFLLEKIKENKIKYESIYQILFGNKHLLLKSIKNKVEIIRYCQESMFTTDFIFDAIRSNNKVIRYIPKKLKSYELYENIIDKYPHLLNYVPKKFKTKELCIKVYNVDKDYWVLLPSKFKNSKKFMKKFCA